jgi:hypothetical protein
MNFNQIQVTKTTAGFVVYGPFGSVMHADLDKNITYSNMVEGSGPYVNLQKALKKAK